MFYALYDTFVHAGRKEYSHGFANTKSVMAFKTQAQRAGFLANTYDLSAREISRAEALKLADKRREDEYVGEDECVICTESRLSHDRICVAKKGF